MEEENIKHEKIYKKIMLIVLTAFITFIITTFAIFSKKNRVTYYCYW